ncbi:MAG: imidazolonepropionase [Melioribacteraceae bacterium]|nr:imidazolonepropionase [Melioribacteraceae bacterium]
MKTLFRNPSQIITVETNGLNFKRGISMNAISLLENHSLLIEDGKILDIIPNNSLGRKKFDQIIDLKDKVILPGLIDCHTHTAFAGSRSGEFRERLAGVSYEEIAEKGGGINSTVRSVRQSSLEDLVELMKPRIQRFIQQGVTTLEIKSGYGLSYFDEIKILKAIDQIKQWSAITIIPTFLGAHTFPPEYQHEKNGYIKLLTEQMLPYVAQNKLAKFCDGFCEKTAFNSNEIDQIFTVATELGLPLKLHTEQFNNIGGLETALKHNATSVDHLEVLADTDIQKLSKSETVSVLLPGVSFFLNYGFAPARKLIENDAIVALATDYNPGSSHISNLHLIISMACISMGMSVEEAISAVTINAAKALGLENEVGSLEIGKNADLMVLDTTEFSDLVYFVGENKNYMTIKNGNIIYQKSE